MRINCIINGLITISLSVILSSCIIDGYSKKGRPNNVPESALWRGGPDGGEWIEFVENHDGLYRFRIYSDEKGDLMLDADFEFKYKDSLELQDTGWVNSISCFYETDEYFVLNINGMSENEKFSNMLCSTGIPYGGYYAIPEKFCIKCPVVFCELGESTSIAIYSDSTCQSKIVDIDKVSIIRDSLRFALKSKSRKSYKVIVYSKTLDKLLTTGWIERLDNIKVRPSTDKGIVLYEHPTLSSEVIARYTRG